MNLRLKVMIPPYRVGDIVSNDSLTDAADRIARGHVEETTDAVTNTFKQVPLPPVPTDAATAQAQLQELAGRTQILMGQIAGMQADLAKERAEVQQWKQMAETESEDLAKARQEIDQLRAELSQARLGAKTVLTPTGGDTLTPKAQ